MNRIGNLIKDAFSTVRSCNSGLSEFERKEEPSLFEDGDKIFDDFTPPYRPIEESRPFEEVGLTNFISKIETIDNKKDITYNEVKNYNKTPESTSEPENTDEASLEKTLTDFGKSINESNFRDYKKNNEKVFTRSELYKNIEKMLPSSNPEIAGIGETLADLYEELGVDLWNLHSNDPVEILSQYANTNTTRSNIIMDTVIAAIKGEELDPKPGRKSILTNIGEQSGVTIDELMALDKNGDGSIIEELKELLTDKDFVDTCKFKLQRQINYYENSKLVNELDEKNIKDGSVYRGDEKITEKELKSAFGNNEIADLFKLSDGSVDKSLLLVLGAEKGKDGTYSISTSALRSQIYIMDANRDGKITKEEVEQFKNSDHYKELLNFYL